MSLKRNLTREEVEAWNWFRTPTGAYRPSYQKPGLNDPKFSKANSWDHEGMNLEQAHKCQVAGHAWVMEAYELETRRVRDFVCLTERFILETETNKKRYEEKLSEGAYKSEGFLVKTNKLWTNKDSLVEFRIVRDFRHNHFPFAFTLSLAGIKGVDDKSLGVMVKNLIKESQKQAEIHNLKQEENHVGRKKE